jgi:phage baseplate assembly protein W
MSTLEPVASNWDDYPQVGVGWAFPVGWGDELRLSSGAERIREALTLIIRTGLFERVMRPKFGAGVDRYVFDLRTAEVCRRLEEDVRRALLLSEPRVLVDRLEAVPAGVTEDRIDVFVEYRIDRHRRPENLVLPFHIAGERS